MPRVLIMVHCILNGFHCFLINVWSSIVTWLLSDLLIDTNPLLIMTWHLIRTNIRFQMKTALSSTWCMQLSVENIERSMQIMNIDGRYTLKILSKMKVIKKEYQYTLDMQRKNWSFFIRHSLIAFFFTWLIWPWPLKMKKLRHSWKCRWWTPGTDVHNSFTVKISKNQIHWASQYA